MEVGRYATRGLFPPPRKSRLLAVSAVMPKLLWQHESVGDKLHLSRLWCELLTFDYASTSRLLASVQRSRSVAEDDEHMPDSGLPKETSYCSHFVGGYGKLFLIKVLPKHVHFLLSSTHS